MAKEKERVLTPHHDALVISLTVANCLVKRILVDNGSSDNIIFQAAYKDLGLEKHALTRRITPLIGFSGEVKQTAGEVTLPLYAEGINMSTKFLVVDCDPDVKLHVCEQVIARLIDWGFGISIDTLVETSTDYSIGISIDALSQALMRGLNMLTKLPRSALAYSRNVSSVRMDSG
ncbi:hypothetical protein F2Q70_00017342 [Brassica cretica]|uniref:Peptidase A2 domain-containing protein n=1 Tax=Brassica cretica TaxID=69181 RepID=A0A8S9HZ96_BRACR|nr:hypothetical protein F2Q70_00017342 [Brassica cretica]